VHWHEAAEGDGEPATPFVPLVRDGTIRITPLYEKVARSARSWFSCTSRHISWDNSSRIGPTGTATTRRTKRSTRGSQRSHQNRRRPLRARRHGRRDRDLGGCRLERRRVRGPDPERIPQQPKNPAGLGGPSVVEIQT